MELVIVHVAGEPSYKTLSLPQISQTTVNDRLCQFVNISFKGGGLFEKKMN